MEISYGIELFLRLFLAYLVVEFVLRPASPAKDWSGNGWRSGRLAYHAFTAGLLTFLLAGLWSIIVVLRYPSSLPGLLPGFQDVFLYAFVLVAAAHLVIDGVLPGLVTGLRERANRGGDPEKESFRMFFINFAAHTAILFIVLLLLSLETPVPCPFGNPVEMIRIWVVVIAFLLVLRPGGMLVGSVIRSWRKDMDSSEEDGLDHAGRLIGYVERVLIVTFILVNEYTAIGFLIAAKGLFRINDTKRSEYIIVGTMMSFAVAVLIGAAAGYLVCQGGIEQFIQYLSEFLQPSRM
ncbi:DUF3307 domain-containing protein [Methanoculleus sp. YWC-01]|uniref:DUF3307 domain-containing protein n=1 Tax=Methanoculleus nereidis TaxID=2735141 RepID=A0ABU3Z3A9_9EURY|nr:DUF3307 domain-containing protein [Methanoculleus sp. YWC-01]MDV4343311.1 DUF3307 domain-containing protein [Methanoculleus sp. YWC-01]